MSVCVCDDPWAPGARRQALPGGAATSGIKPPQLPLGHRNPRLLSASQSHMDLASLEDRDFSFGVAHGNVGTRVSFRSRSCTFSFAHCKV